MKNRPPNTENDKNGIISGMKITRLYRQNWIKIEKPFLTEILNKFPRFVDMPFLIDEDFKQISEKTMKNSNNLIVKWPIIYKNNIIKFMNSKKDKNIQTLIESFKKSKDEDEQSIIALELLCLLLAPNNVRGQKEKIGNSVIKNFIFQRFKAGTPPTEICDQCNELSKQPILIILDNKQIFLKLDNSLLNLQLSFISSLNLLFKSFWAFDIESKNVPRSNYKLTTTTTYQTANTTITSSATTLTKDTNSNISLNVNQDFEVVDGLSKLNISQQATILNDSCDTSVYNPDQMYNNENVYIFEENNSTVEEISSIELIISGVEPNIKIEWKCEQFNFNSFGKCNGRVKTIGYYEPVEEVTSHNHLPDPAKTECLLALEKLKDLATKTSQNPRSIIKQSQTGLSQESASKMVRANNLTQVIKRIQNNKIDSHDKATCVRETITYDNEIFLLDDSGEDDNERVIIFSKEANIKLLNSSSDWFCDGTFAVSPKIFYQLYTINVLVNGKNLPVVYALLCNKKEESYNKLFNMLNHYIKNQPKNILTDFEKAVLNALRLAYPGTRLVRCYFHLVQNFWKHIQSFGLVKLYASDADIRKNFKFLQALAFVPKKDVIFCLNQIKANCPNKFMPMLNYFEKYYIGNLKKNSSSIRHVPLFTIDLWNIHDRIVNGLPRTNNSLESWHKQFELDAKKHQTVFKLVEQFRSVSWRCANRPCSASVTTWNERALSNDKEHFDDFLSDIDIMIIRKLECLNKQAEELDTPIPKLYFKSRAELVADGVDESYLARNSINPANAKKVEDIKLEGEYIVCEDGHSRFLLFDTNDVIVF
ncbi:unnamed protein product [Brachionus calyciflorus]|uniref:MULE transposase domain-containing protein n=1 Tax=Brachionus calyciflorus TaxID=104777 RepID=A0A813M3B9_9BILA|nr:unnamed protein product [Brachionus calyciflorus]